MDTSCEIRMEHLTELIQQHMPLIIRTISSVTGRYVSAEHDDEFSVALEAFSEAIQCFNAGRGPFEPFAAMVIRSRLLTHLQQETRHAALSLEGLQESGWDAAAPDPACGDLAEEIQLYRQELALFGLTLEGLAEASPKHQDTRQRAIGIAEHSSHSTEIVQKTYSKRKLPVRAVARFCSVSEKIVKTSKTFILATMLVFVQALPCLADWIKGTKVTECTR